MYQLYFLSIATLILSSVSLGFDRLDDQFRVSGFFSRELFTSEGFRLGLGMMTVLVGFFKFIIVAGDGMVVLGDLLPAVAGIVLGGTLVLMFYEARTTVESDSVSTLDRIFVQNASNLSLLGLMIAVLHLVLPRVLFL